MNRFCIKCINHLLRIFITVLFASVSTACIHVSDLISDLLWNHLRTPCSPCLCFPCSLFPIWLWCLNILALPYTKPELSAIHVTHWLPSWKIKTHPVFWCTERHNKDIQNSCIPCPFLDVELSVQSVLKVGQRCQRRNPENQDML